MHFLVHTVQEKFGDIINFEAELRFIEKAALGKIFVQLFACYLHLTLMNKHKIHAINTVFHNLMAVHFQMYKFKSFVIDKC